LTVASIFALTDTQHLSAQSGLVDRLKKSFTANALGAWRLDHRLLRSTPNSSEDKSSTRWQHVLHLGHFPRNIYIGIEQENNSSKKGGSAANGKPDDETKGSGTNDRLSITTIPVAQRDSYNTLLAAKLALLWTPKSVVSVPHGIAFEVGDSIVRMGELRAAGSGQGVRAVLVSIQVPSGEAPDGVMAKDDETAVRMVISEMWQRFEIEGAKEAWGFGGPADEVRAWCEILKVR
jgi:hypothetical protein